MLDTKEIFDFLGIDPKIIKDFEGEIQLRNHTYNEDQAREYMSKFWVLKTTLTEWVSLASRYEAETKIDRGTILVVEKNKSDEKSEAAKERVATSTEGYEEANQLYQTAKIVKLMLEMKRGDLTEGHYMMKTILNSLISERAMMPSGEPKSDAPAQNQW